MDGQDMQALYPREQSPYETFLVSVGDPSQNPVAVALPNQENAFFSGKPSKMIFSDEGGALVTVTGVFRGKGETGEWSGSQNGTVYRLKTVKSKMAGEDQSVGNGQLQIGDAKSPIYNISWCSGFC
jgi:hypothetical protein